MAVDEHQELREIIRETIIRPAEREVARMIIHRAIEQMTQRKKQTQVAMDQFSYPLSPHERQQLAAFLQDT